ncbi:Hypothetical protein ABZS17D1_00471 [Kosakonia cowanii]
MHCGVRVALINSQSRAQRCNDQQSNHHETFKHCVTSPR